MPTFTVSIPGGRIGSFLAGAAVASVIGGTAVAITSTDFTYSTTKQGYYTISAMAMAPQDNPSDFTLDYPNSLSGPGCYQTGFNLPEGATLVSVTTWYRSNAMSNLGVYVYRGNLPVGVFNYLITASIADDSNTRKPKTHTVPANLQTVDNLYFSYGYAVCPGVGSWFDGARINYLYQTAGD